ncbi:MAG TPA: nuclear transport factor 2 family protein [Acidimicrobiales bacterium]|nr:nuclear transport factor 2 family protein [Acidimicrobiales bacterium]
MPGVEEMVRELWARAQVAELPMRYARGVDRRDWDLVRACFSADAFVDGTRSTGPVDDYLAELRPAVERWAATMHVMANQLVSIEGERASMETYAVAFHWAVAPAGSPSPDNLIVGVRYHDEVSFLEGGWVITRRVVSGDWSVAGT